MPVPHPDLCLLDRGAALKLRVFSEPGGRTPELLTAVVGQFCLPQNPRHLAVTMPKPGGGVSHVTYCNIASWDWSRGMNAELPHWVFPDGTIAPPYAKGAGELNCNRLLGWLSVHGERYHWTQLDRESDAEAAACRGEPVVAMWRNPTGGPGHIGVGVPTPEGKKGLHIAQAGSVNFECRPLKDGFATVSPVVFWTHP